MNVGNMNMQLIVPRIPEAQQVQHNINQYGDVMQALSAEREKKDAALKEKQVRTKEKMEDGKVKEDLTDRGGYGGTGANRGKEEKEEEINEKMAIDAIRGRNIDIHF